MFDYDWFHGSAFEQQQEDAKTRCALAQFSDVPAEELADHEPYQSYRDELLVRTLIYLRDGFSYEVRDLAQIETKSHLVFECEPVDQQYKVGAFVVSLPFEEIVRVEVFAVHPSEKPEDFPQITGFRGAPDHGESGPQEPHPRQPAR